MDAAPLAVATRHAAAAEDRVLGALRQTARVLFGTEPAYCALGMVGPWRGAPGEGFRLAALAANGKPAPWRRTLALEAFFAAADGRPTRVVARYRADGIALDRAIPVGADGIAAAATRALVGL